MKKLKNTMYSKISIKFIKKELPKEIAYCIPENSDIMLEKIEKKLKNFNGKVIGYEFKKIENKG